ncbi:MAG: LPS-assembly protein LptD [Saprospirales bacterium]|nr:LPS-assembly protein LptD [Saprospirales bacterium]
MNRFFKHNRIIIFIVIIFMMPTVFSQIRKPKPIKVMNNELLDKISSNITDDSTQTNVTNTIPDSLAKNSTNVDVKKYKVNDGDLDDIVKYKAEDSIIYDIPNSTVYLYGNANIIYQEFDMKGGFIKFNWDSSEVYAKATPDSSGELKRIEFKDGSGEYVAYEAKFNFNTKKGKSVGLVTKEMDGFLHGMQVKVIDTNTMYIKGARYTTCDLDDPHFYIELNKAKVIKDKIMVGKPANVVIEGVRTPLFLPFAILPSLKSKGTGLLMPTYGDGQSLGFLSVDSVIIITSMIRWIYKQQLIFIH